MKILVVGGQHGDEKLGGVVVQALVREKIGSVSGIVGNPRAFDQNVRYIDQDLNRSFPGDPQGNYEQRRAHELLPLVRAADVVLDIHTTTSDIKMTPIVAEVSGLVSTVLSYSLAKNIVVMGDAAIKNSLIGHAKVGVSLEFGLTYSQTPDALQEVLDIVKGLQNGEVRPKQKRRVYHVAGKISLDTKLPADAKNFELVEDLGIYPFLLHEKSYVDFQGFYADSYEEVEI